ncbi:MAG: FAD:protein FMN transferase [Verrucomicrobiales bacterium]
MALESNQPRFTRRKVLTLGAGYLFLRNPMATTIAAEPGLRKVTKTSHALGSAVSLTVIHRDTAVAEAAIDAAFRELDLIENVMSIYRPESQISRLNRDGELDAPDPRLLAVLKFASQVSARSNGAFDMTVQPLWQIFHRAKQRNDLPDEAEIAEAIEKVNWKQVRISDSSISLEGKGTAITLNGVAQGYAADRVKELLSGAGITDALIDCGEINALGKSSDNVPWKVGIQHPREEDAFISIARLSGRCLATSGDYATHFGGSGGDAFRWNHLFDPKTGKSPELLASVSVAANTAMEADALSTAVFVAGIDRGRELIESYSGAEALLVLKNGRTLTTKGFPC